MVRIVSATLVAGIITITLTACGSDDERSTSATVAPSTAVEADVQAVTATPRSKMVGHLDKTRPEPERSPRGNIIKALGEVAGIGEADAPLAEWTVDAIEVDGLCASELAEDPELGHFLILTISVSAGSALADTEYGVPSIDFNEHDFTVIGPDGISENTNATAATYGCLEETELLPDTIGPGENAVGKLVLDTTHTSGILTHRPWWGDGGGWEWEF